MNQAAIPKHIAIVMDGNGRWATSRGLPRVMGHRAGVQAARNIIQAASEQNIKILSLFAFSQDNWQRPQAEINHLFKILSSNLSKHTEQLIKNNIKLNFVGDISALPKALQAKMQAVSEQSSHNSGLILNILINYSGKWDMTQAVRALVTDLQTTGASSDAISEQMLSRYLVLQDLPEPDLFIRTSGELRISNCFLWQLAYTELFFTPVLWPDFSKQDFQQALATFAQRERRFGKTKEQIA